MDDLSNPSSIESQPYSGWSDSLRPHLHEVIDELEGMVDLIADRTSLAVASELPEFRAGTSDSLMGEVPGLVRVNVLLLVKVLREERMPIPEEFAFLISQVATRVQQGLSMRGMLRGYRIGHGIAWNTAIEVCDEKAIGGELIKALSTPTMAFVDHLSAAVSDAYLQATRISEAESDAEERKFMDSVLAGREPADSTFARRSLSILDSPQGFLVVCAKPAGSLDLPATSLRRLAATMGQLGSAGGRRAVAVPRQDGVIGFFAIGDQGSALVCSNLLDTHPLFEREAGNPVLIGVGLPCSGIAETVRGLEGAEAALAMATPERPLVSLPTLPLFDYLTGQADATLREVVRSRMDRFREADEKAGGALSETVRAYVAANQNSRLTAKALHCHYNTVNYRIEKIESLTGLDPNRLSDLIELYTSLQIGEPSAG